jgi:small-conductance mechanosensitive channel
MLAVAILDEAGETLGGFLPRFGGALVLLVVGVALARLTGRLVRRALAAAGADSLAESWGIADVFARVGLPRAISTVIGRVVRIVGTLVVLFAALSLLGLESLNASLNAAVLFLPNVLAAVALLVAGVVVSTWLRDRVDRLAYQLDFPVPIGQVVQFVVLAVFALTAAAQLTLPTDILMLLVMILLGAAAATFTLAFGLGARDVAGALSAGRYVSGTYRVGQTISTGGVRGEIVALDPTSTVLRTTEGATVRVPNHVLLSSIVTVHGE